MGVINTTPDSFSDGGLHLRAADAIAAGEAMALAGTRILDIGGESTRPGGAARVGAAEETDRVLPVIEALRSRTGAFLSIDTTRAEVAEAALAAGADIVNDISGLRFDPRLGEVAAGRGAPIILMHLRGSFDTMHRAPHYDSVLAEVAGELCAAQERARACGIAAEMILLDPGIGFAKDAAHSLEVLRELPAYQSLDRPLVVGVSRKSFIGKVLDLPVGERLHGTSAAVAASILGGAHVVRVHDAAAMIQVARVCDAIAGGLG
jgi:dihydropteroate synthase